MDMGDCKIGICVILFLNARLGCLRIETLGTYFSPKGGSLLPARSKEKEKKKRNRMRRMEKIKTTKTKMKMK